MLGWLIILKGIIKVGARCLAGLLFLLRLACGPFEK